MNVLQSDNHMALVNVEPKTLLICFDEREVTIEPKEEGGEVVTKYEYDYCRVARNADRGGIIDAIVRSRYSQSSMEAVVNNYLRENKTEDDVAEFTAMQAWRTKAHDVAERVMAVNEEEPIEN